jgi:hypothetical protein
VKISSRLLDFSAITLSNILIRTILSKKCRIWGFHNNATLNVILLIQFVRIQCMQNYAGIRLFLCACQTLYKSYASHWAPLCVRSCQLLALTGCDTTSSFFGIGKKSMFILPAICSDRYGIVSTFPSDHTALILVFGLDRLNHLCQSILFETNH